MPAIDMDDRDVELAALAARRRRVVLALAGAMLGIYLGFVLLWALAKDTLAEQVVGQVSLGIILGALVIAATWTLTAIYVRWANAHDDAVDRVMRRA
jgi:uncharacterized membrane protein (DUF485 family)